MASQSTVPARPLNNNNYLPNGAVPTPGARPLLPNHGQVIEQGATRILCVADVRGNLKSLNDLAKAARADCIIHTGDFGFYDERSLERIAEKTLRHVAQYSPLISEDVRRQVISSPPNQPIKQRFSPAQLPLSQLSQFLNGSMSFDIPVYTVWGACEDVQVLERIRSGEYKINNLHVIDEENTRKLEVNGVKLRLLGLGGAIVMHKLFDNGEGRTTIAGGQGTMWTTFLQIGMLISTAMAAYDPSETRVLVTHASPSREGLLNQLAVHLKVDFSISAGLHFRYGSSHNEFSVNPSFDHYRGKLAASKSSFNDVWETVKSEVEPVVSQDETQNKCLQNALQVVDRMPSVATGGGPFSSQGASEDVESAFKNMWNFNLSDAAFGYLVLEVEGGRVAAEMKSQGFNFGHRGNKALANAQDAAKVGAPSPSGAGIGAPPSAAPQARPPVSSAVNPAVPNVRPNQPAQQQQPQPQAPAPAVPPQHASQPPINRGPAPADAGSKPAPATNGVSDKQTGGDGRANGDADTAASPAPAEKKPSQAVFIQNATTEDEVRNMFAEADRGKIERIEQRGNNSVAHFASPEAMKAVFDNAPESSKKRNPGKPTIKVYEERRPGYGAGTWGSGRGGQQGGGYRSGGNGAASDSEGGRGGRGGGYRGRGRGTDRGGRGRGGGGGGRGGFKGPGEGSGAPSPAPAAAS